MQVLRMGTYGRMGRNPIGGIMETPFTYWPLENNWPDDGKPEAGEPKEPKWGVGKWGPRYYVVCDEADVKAMVIALNDCDIQIG
jgi:hypothetical protein